MVLAPIFVAHAPKALRLELGANLELDAQLEAAVHSGRRAWPQVELAPEIFAAHLAAHLNEGADARTPLEGTATDDLYLARACAEGDPAAVQSFVAFYMDTIRGVIGRIAPLAVDDVAQRVLTGLLAGDNPSIRTYGGRSSLRFWLRVVTTRAVYAHAKREGRHVGDDLDAIADCLDSHDDDPEVERLKKRYRAEFKRGFAHAFSCLDVRERNLLRHEHLDGVGVAEMAELYDVHRATVTRWRNHARQKLLSQTRQFFRNEVSVDSQEFDSVLRLIESQLDVSLSRLLRGKRGDKE